MTWQLWNCKSMYYIEIMDVYLEMPACHQHAFCAQHNTYQPFEPSLKEVNYVGRFLKRLCQFCDYLWVWRRSFFFAFCPEISSKFRSDFFSWEGGIWKAKWCYGPSFFCSWRGPWPPGPPLYVRLCPRLYICTWLNSKGGGLSRMSPPPHATPLLKGLGATEKTCACIGRQQFSMLFVMISHYYFMISVWYMCNNITL